MWCPNSRDPNNGPMTAAFMSQSFEIVLLAILFVKNRGSTLRGELVWYSERLNYPLNAHIAEVLAKSIHLDW